MTFLFVVSVFFCIYTYVLFPLLLHWRARKLKHAPSMVSVEKSAAELANMDLPRVSIVVAAHNEAGTLSAKFASLDALTYPIGLLECIFVSDGSTDDTPKLLRTACGARERWHFDHYEPGAGKPTALNLGVSRAIGDIIVFMDARQTVQADAIHALVARLADPEVGAVSGELVLQDQHGNEAGNVGLYWRYEKWIRENESRLFSTTGATGALYAIRRSDFTPLDSDSLLDDFDTPIRLLRQRKRTVFTSAAQIFDQVESDVSGEFGRKVRTLAGNFQSFNRNRWLFNPASNAVWWQFLSHKVFRLLVPYALILAFAACVLGQGLFLKTMLVAQIAFYAVGLAGMLGVSNRLSNVLNLFLQLNAAAVLAAIRALTGSSSVRWKSS